MTLIEMSFYPTLNQPDFRYYPSFCADHTFVALLQCIARSIELQGHGKAQLELACYQNSTSSGAAAVAWSTVKGGTKL